MTDVTALGAVRVNCPLGRPGALVDLDLDDPAHVRAVDRGWVVLVDDAPAEAPATPGPPVPTADPFPPPFVPRSGEVGDSPADEHVALRAADDTGDDASSP